jgi:hypothetical protein
MLQKALAHLVAAPSTFNLVVSNIPGPREPMCLLGCELEEAYPVVPFTQHVFDGQDVTADELREDVISNRKPAPSPRAMG